ncbi:unnamed protein product, partial [Pylaiella littoralis]
RSTACGTDHGRCVREGHSPRVRRIVNSENNGLLGCYYGAPPSRLRRKATGWQRWASWLVPLLNTPFRHCGGPDRDDGTVGGLSSRWAWCCLAERQYIPISTPRRRCWCCENCAGPMLDTFSVATKDHMVAHNSSQDSFTFVCCRFEQSVCVCFNCCRDTSTAS